MKNKNIVITGASRRLGLFLVKELSAKGNHIFAITRAISPELKAIEGENVTLIEVGEYTKHSAELSAKKIFSKNSKVDLLINNASAFKKDDDGDDIFWLDIFYRTHIVFPYALTKALRPGLSSQSHPGVVINITDIYADNPNPDYSLYCSTKAALSNLTVGLAKKYARNIRFMSIAPGPIKFLPEHTSENKKEVLYQTLIAKEGGFTPVLKTIDFILDNDYLTASTIKVDGGRSVFNW